MDRITCRESCKCHMAVSGQVRRGKRGFPAMANDICTCKRTGISFCAARSSRTAQVRSCSCSCSSCSCSCYYYFFLLVVVVVLVLVRVLVLDCCSCCYLQSTGRRLQKGAGGTQPLCCHKRGAQCKLQKVDKSVGTRGVLSWRMRLVL